MTHTSLPWGHYGISLWKTRHVHHTIWTRLNPHNMEAQIWNEKISLFFSKRNFTKVRLIFCAFSSQDGKSAIRSLCRIYLIRNQVAFSALSPFQESQKLPSTTRWERRELIRNKFPPRFTLHSPSTVSFEKAESNLPLTRENSNCVPNRLGGERAGKHMVNSSHHNWFLVTIQTNYKVCMKLYSCAYETVESAFCMRGNPHKKSDQNPGLTCN